jgi:hypothetical protein
MSRARHRNHSNAQTAAGTADGRRVTRAPAAAPGAASPAVHVHGHTQAVEDMAAVWNRPRMLLNSAGRIV